MSSSSNELLSQPLRSELVDLYFDFVHDKFHSLFHKPTIVEDVRNGRLPMVLVYGMAALSARFLHLHVQHITLS
jgi:hypothetical protein